MRHVGLVSTGSYEHISGMVMAGHMSNEVIRAFILKALMPLVFIRTFPSSLQLCFWGFSDSKIEGKYTVFCVKSTIY